MTQTRTEFKVWLTEGTQFIAEGKTPAGTPVYYRLLNGKVNLSYTIKGWGTLPTHEQVLDDIGDFSDALTDEQRATIVPSIEDPAVRIFFNRYRVHAVQIDKINAYADRLRAWADAQGFSRDVINHAQIIEDARDGLLPEIAGEAEV